MLNASATAQDLRESLRPIWRRLASERTLSNGKVGVLGYLEKHGPATATTLAASEKISPQAITTAVREMEELGLIARTPDSADRRRIWIELTDAGRQRLATERAMGTDWLERAIADRLSADEQAVLDSSISILRKLVEDAAVD